MLRTTLNAVVAAILLSSVSSFAEHQALSPPAIAPLPAQGAIGELRENRYERRDDRQDLQLLESLLARMNQGRSWRRYGRSDSVDRELAEFVRSEWYESRAELQSDRQEINRDLREARFRQAGPYFRPDRGDLRDDVGDQRREWVSFRQLNSIANELANLYGRFDWRSQTRKYELVGQLINRERAEIAENRSEAREDHYRHGYRG